MRAQKPLADDARLDLLMVGQPPLWPSDQGVSLRGLPMLQAWRRQGHRVAYAAFQPLEAKADDAVKSLTLDWPGASSDDLAELHRGWAGPAAWLRRRLAEHQGLALSTLAGVVTLVKRHQPAIVMGLGLHSPLLLKALGALPVDQRPRRVWYAADELIRYHLTCLPTDRPGQWPARLHEMTLHGLIESLFARGLEMGVGVSEQESRWLRCVAGVRQAVTIPNGVDLTYWSPPLIPPPSPPSPSTPPALPSLLPPSMSPPDNAGLCCRLEFWGRLDFTPNADAIQWFARHVWPTLKQRFPQAQWTIAGTAAPPKIVELSQDARSGVAWLGRVADLRQVMTGAGLAILPMRCGGGIKNKLLEAAAMHKAIIASPIAVDGLRYDELNPPFVLAKHPQQWIDAITANWLDPLGAKRLGQRAGQWVADRHRWDLAAKKLWQPMMADRAVA